MAMYLWTIVLLSIFMIFPDWWFYMKMKKNNFYLWFRWLSLVPLIFFIVVFFYIRFGLRYQGNFLLTARISWIFIFVSLIYVPKLFYILFYYINRLYNRIFNARTRVLRITGFSLGVGFAAIIFYGLIVTRDNFYVKQQTIEVRDLPDGFDGYKIAVIADFHLGNWNKRYTIMEQITELINAQNADLIVFAGDMINNYEEETKGWEPYFNQLKCQTGKKYAVLGNHDYGDYTHWENPEDKERNLEKTKQNIRNLGFRLLLNEHEELVKGGDTISIIGVENYGAKHFDAYSDLPKALSGTNPDRKKILISHDPTHWEDEVINEHPSIFLTIAGHTHAGQLGFVRAGFKISPSALVFHQWDGLYRHQDQYLYVNRGIGYVGIPVRVGVPPEITLIELKKDVRRWDSY